MNYLETLRAKLAEMIEGRAVLVAGLESIVAAPEAESRAAFTDEEQVAFDAAMLEVREADEAIEAIETRVADMQKVVDGQRAAEDVQRVAPAHVPNVNLARNPHDLSDVRYGAAGRADLHGRVREILSEDNESRLTLSGNERESVNAKLGFDTRDGRMARHIILHSTDTYRSAWAKLVSGNGELLDNEERAAVSEARAASLTDGAGGFAVPTTLDVSIISTDAGSTNPMRQIATIKQTVTDQWTGVSSAGVTASFDAEAAEVSDDAPTLVAPNIPVYTARAFVPGSIEVFSDWANIEADIRMMFQEAKDDLEATVHFTGTGSAQPTGIVTALDGTASEIAPTTAEVFAPLTDLYKVENALAAKYRARASWTGNKVWYNLVRTAFDDKVAVWEHIGGGQPARMLGYAAYEASAMDSVGPDAAATADNFGLILGDFKQFYIVDRVGMSVEFISHLFATANNLPSGQRGLFAHWRTGSDSVNDGAFAMLSIPTTA